LQAFTDWPNCQKQHKATHTKKLLKRRVDAKKIHPDESDNLMKLIQTFFLATGTSACDQKSPVTAKGNELSGRDTKAAMYSAPHSFKKGNQNQRNRPIKNAFIDKRIETLKPIESKRTPSFFRRSMTCDSLDPFDLTGASESGLEGTGSDCSEQRRKYSKMKCE
jgi:hypothetical protein